MIALYDRGGGIGLGIINFGRFVGKERRREVTKRSEIAVEGVETETKRGELDGAP
jgi:hypothetical protein